MIRRPPRATRTDTPFPSTTLFRSGITAVGLLGAMAASIPASSPARAQDGPVVVNCFDEAHETVKRIPAKDCKGRAISAAEAAEVRKRRQEYIQKVLAKAPHSDVEDRKSTRLNSSH